MALELIMELKPSISEDWHVTNVQVCNQKSWLDLRDVRHKCMQLAVNFYSSAVGPWKKINLFLKHELQPTGPRLSVAKVLIDRRWPVLLLRPLQCLQTCFCYSMSNYSCCSLPNWKFSRSLPNVDVAFITDAQRLKFCLWCVNLGGSFSYSLLL